MRLGYDSYLTIMGTKLAISNPAALTYKKKVFLLGA
jgi:hypothetical protein